MTSPCLDSAGVRAACLELADAICAADDAGAAAALSLVRSTRNQLRYDSNISRHLTKYLKRKRKNDHRATLPLTISFASDTDFFLPIAVRKRLADRFHVDFIFDGKIALVGNGYVPPAMRWDGVFARACVDREGNVSFHSTGGEPFSFFEKRGESDK